MPALSKLSSHITNTDAQHVMEAGTQEGNHCQSNHGLSYLLSCCAQLLFQGTMSLQSASIEPQGDPRHETTQVCGQAS